MGKKKNNIFFFPIIIEIWERKKIFFFSFPFYFLHGKEKWIFFTKNGKEKNFSFFLSHVKNKMGKKKMKIMGKKKTNFNFFLSHTIFFLSHVQKMGKKKGKIFFFFPIKKMGKKKGMFYGKEK